MQTKSVEVKIKSKVVEVVDVPVYSTVDEIGDALKADQIVDLINRQLKTDISNAARAKHRESAPGKTKRYNAGFNALPGVTFSDGETGIDKLTQILSLPEDERKAAMDTLIASPEVQAAVDKKLGVAADAA